MSKSKAAITSVSWLPGDKPMKDEVGLYLGLKSMGFSDYVRRLLRRDHKNRKQILARREKV